MGFHVKVSSPHLSSIYIVQQTFTYVGNMHLVYKHYCLFIYLYLARIQYELAKCAFRLCLNPWKCGGQ